jgi:hypothetical protein
MQKLSRRGLIKQASIGVGAVGMLSATTAGQLSFETSHATSAKTAEHAVPSSDESLVVCITNPGTNMLTIMRGEREIVVKNAAIVKQLLSF